MNIERSDQDGARVYALSGGLVFDAHRDFHGVMRGLREDTAEAVTLDLSRVDKLDLAGLGMLILAQEACEKTGKPIRFHKPPRILSDMLSLTHPDRRARLGQVLRDAA